MPSQLTLQDIASGSQITALDASKLSGTLPAISGANLTNLPDNSINGIADSVEYTATAGQTTFAATYDSGADTAYLTVYLNGVRLDAGDYTATNGTSVILDTGASVGDTVYILIFGSFVLANHYTKLEIDAKHITITGATGPLITTNPINGLGTVYSNSTDSTLWVCFDATTNGNKWKNVHSGDIVQPNSPPTNPTNTGAFPANGSENSTFNFTFSGATDVTGSVTHYLVDNISNPGLSVTTAEVAVGTQHDFTCNAVTGGTPLTLRVRAKDEFGVYSSGVTINFTVLDTVYYAATGGSITTVGDYKYHTFTSSGTFTVTTAGNTPSGGVDYLTVAGGGGAGTDNSGGGGAGGYLSVTSSTPSATAYSVVVGAGGAGSGSGGNNGGPSSVFGTSTVGGGRGSQWSSCVGGNGGSGGGSCNANNNPGDGTVGQGNDGGTAYNDGRTGGGGGAGSVGFNASSAEGGDGGSGLQWLNGNYYAGGGGGCGEGASLGGGEGQHGGGNGSNGRDGGANGATSGTANTGGGSGGPRLRNGTFNGGSGIVIIRYKWQN